jgi:hypothetical protein
MKNRFIKTKYLSLIIFFLFLNQCELKQELNINGAFVSPFITIDKLKLNGSIISDEVALQSSSTTISLPRTVVTEKSILFCSYRYGGSALSYSSTCSLNTSGNSIEVKTGGMYSGTYVRYTILEFSLGVTVLRGEISVLNNSIGKNLEFSKSLDLTKNFVIFDTRGTSTDTTIDRGRFFKGSFTTSSKLEFKREAISPQIEINYQIIQMDGVQVQYGNVNLASGVVSTTKSITQVNLSKSILFTSQTADSTTGGVEGNYMVNSKFESNTSLEFSRKGSAGALDINYFVVEFTGNQVVIPGTCNVSETQKACSSNLSTQIQDTNSVVLLFSNNINSTSSSDMDLSYFTGSISGVGQNSNVTFERVRQGGISVLSYFVIDF